MQKKMDNSMFLSLNKTLYILILLPILSLAQPQPDSELGYKIDGVAAVIGNEIVTDSDIERDYVLSQQQSGNNISKCEFLNSALANKLILHHAKLDTLISITNDEIERRVDYQINDFRSRTSSDDEFLKALGYSTIAELRTELTNVFRDNAYIQRKQQSIVQDIDATPEEVREFYVSNRDQLPDVPEELELSHIVMHPELSDENRQKIIDKLNKIKQEIEDGASFATKAILESEGPSATDGGLIKNVKRKQMVPEFDAVVFNLDEGQISEPFETEFGYHIALLEKRRGQAIDFRHILIKPKYTEEEINKAFNKLDSIRKDILNNKITFKEAVREYSSDKYTKYNGGLMKNPETGDSRFDRSKLPVKMLSSIVGLKEGEVSYVFQDKFGERDQKDVVRLLEVQRIIPAHQVNFETDYVRLKNYTIQPKQFEVLNKWMNNHIPETFVKIHPDFQNCDYEYNWTKE